MAITLPSQPLHPHHFFVLYCKHQTVYETNSSYFLCLTEEARFLGVETNPGPRRPVPAVCRILCRNVRGQAVNLSHLTVASSQYDILLCSQNLVSDMRHVSDYWFPDLVALSCCAVLDALGPRDGCIRTRGSQNILPA